MTLELLFCVIAALYIVYLEYRRTRMALDLSKLSAAINALRAERDALKAQVAGVQDEINKAVADATAADQAQVDALVVDPPPGAPAA